MKTTNIILFILILPFFATAATVPAKTSSQNQSGLYVTAVESYEMLSNHPDTLLVDIRDPIEIMFTGFTQLTDIHVPFSIVDASAWDPDKKTYGYTRNQDFVDDVTRALDKLGASKETHIIFMCRSGSSRSAPASDLIYARGYKNTYSMVDGFEGSKSNSADNKGARIVNGWKNSGLPWGWKLDADKMYIVFK